MTSLVGCGAGRAARSEKVGSGTGTRSASGHGSGRQSSNILLKGRFEIRVATNVWVVSRSIPNLHKLSASALNPRAGFRGWCGHVLRATSTFFSIPPHGRVLAKYKLSFVGPLAFDE